MDPAVEIPLVLALLGFLALSFVLIVRTLRWDPAGPQPWNATKKTALFHFLVEVVAVISVDRLGGIVGLLASLLLLTKLLPAGPRAILIYAGAVSTAALVGLRPLLISFAWPYSDLLAQHDLVGVSIEPSTTLPAPGVPVTAPPPPSASAFSTVAAGLTGLLPLGYGGATQPWSEIDDWMRAVRVLGLVLLMIRCYIAAAAAGNWRSCPRSSLAVPPFAPKAMSSQDSGPFRGLICDGAWFWDHVLFPGLQRRLVPLLPLALAGTFWCGVAACMVSCYMHGGWSANDFKQPPGRQFEYGGDVKGAPPNLSQIADLDPERTIWQCTIGVCAFVIAPLIGLMRHRQLGDQLDALLPQWLPKPEVYHLRALRNAATLALFASYLAIFLESIFVLSTGGKWVALLHFWSGYSHGAAAILHHTLQAYVFATLTLHQSRAGRRVQCADVAEKCWYWGCTAAAVGFLVAWVLDRGGTYQWCAVFWETAYFWPYAFSWWREADAHTGAVYFRGGGVVGGGGGTVCGGGVDYGTAGPQQSARQKTRTNDL